MQTQMVELQLQSDRASAEASQLRDHLLKTQALLDQQKAHAEKWSAHSNAVGAEMQRMVLQHEERAEALFKAQETLQLHQVCALHVFHACCHPNAPPVH